LVVDTVGQLREALEEDQTQVVLVVVAELDKVAQLELQGKVLLAEMAE
jgi:hypothetical protein